MNEWINKIWYIHTMEYYAVLKKKEILGWGTQDGLLGGCGICISSQLGHLPGTGGGPWTPKGTGGTPSNWLFQL